jgi:two-component system KDP operon response regulator KdpE
LQIHGERPVFRLGDLSVDLVRRIVKVGDKDVKLSPKEYELLNSGTACRQGLDA